MTQENRKDWSGVVDKLYKAACDNFDYMEGMSINFKAEAISILILSEHLSQPATDGNQSLTGENEEMSQDVTEQSEFITGQWYESVYHGDDEIGILTYIDRDNGVLYNPDVKGEKVTYIRRLKNLRKHVPKTDPREHTIDVWVNVYPNNVTSGYYSSKESADKYSDADRMAILHFTRTFKEGDGL